MDTQDIFDTDVVSLPIIVSCDVIGPPKVVDDSTLGVRYSCGSGVLNGFWGFHGRFNLGFLARRSAAFLCVFSIYFLVYNINI